MLPTMIEAFVISEILQLPVLYPVTGKLAFNPDSVGMLDDYMISITGIYTAKYYDLGR